MLDERYVDPLGEEGDTQGGWQNRPRTYFVIGDGVVGADAVDNPFFGRPV